MHELLIQINKHSRICWYNKNYHIINFKFKVIYPPYLMNNPLKYSNFFIYIKFQIHPCKLFYVWSRQKTKLIHIMSFYKYKYNNPSDYYPLPLISLNYFFISKNGVKHSWYKMIQNVWIYIYIYRTK